MKPKHPGGRPPKTEVPDWAPRIIDWLYQGRSILEFCAQDGNPSRQTIYRWTERDPEFMQQFVRARTARAEALLDRAVEVATKTDGDWVVDEKGARKLNLEAVQQRKLAAEVLIKVASCFQNGEGVTLRVVGDSKADPIQVQTKVEGPQLPRGEDLRKYLRDFFSAAKAQGMVSTDAEEA